MPCLPAGRTLTGALFFLGSFRESARMERSYREQVKLFPLAPRSIISSNFCEYQEYPNKQ
jgi:hypothetical protein